MKNTVAYRRPQVERILSWSLASSAEDSVYKNLKIRLGAIDWAFREFRWTEYSVKLDNVTNIECFGSKMHLISRIRASRASFKIH